MNDDQNQILQGIKDGLPNAEPAQVAERKPSQKVTGKSNTTNATESPKTKALIALAQGASQDLAAKAAGRSRRTVHGWLRQPSFVAELNRLEVENMHRARRKLAAYTDAAVEAILDVLSRPERKGAKVRLSAARAVIDCATRITQMGDLARAQHDMELRLAKLEAEKVLESKREEWLDFDRLSQEEKLALNGMIEKAKREERRRPASALSSAEKQQLGDLLDRVDGDSARTLQGMIESGAAIR